MTFARLAAFLLLAVGVAACGGNDDDDEASPSTAQTGQSADSPDCVAVDSNFMTPLGIGMKDDQYRLKNGQAVQSADHEDVYFVSAEIYGSARGGGQDRNLGDDESRRCRGDLDP
ncbi:MAG: hypothetical protein WKF65_05235 [Gaiellaceae bacterium]